MARNKATDEKIISALLANGTQKEAAKACGISERTLYDRMADGEFEARYRAAKADLVRQAVTTINGQIQAAILTVAEIMSDENNNAAVRLQAAQTILNNAGKFNDRLAVCENMALQQRESNAMGIEFKW